MEIRSNGEKIEITQEKMLIIFIQLSFRLTISISLSLSVNCYKNLYHFYYFF